MEKDGSPDLDVDWFADGWLALLHIWIDEAEQAGIIEPNAMVLATVDDGRPVTRTVLCKSIESDGITFYSNYDSAKGVDLTTTPYASVTFPWYALGRQVHIRGAVVKVSAEETQQYWARRPRGSQLGAWASAQSRPIGSQAELMAQTHRCDAALRRFRSGAGPAALGRLSDRRRGRRVLAGPGEPDSQPDTGNSGPRRRNGSDRASPALVDQASKPRPITSTTRADRSHKHRWHTLARWGSRR